MFLCMEGMICLMVELIYGVGLCVYECVILRVKDLDFIEGWIFICNSKGSKDCIFLLFK